MPPTIFECSVCANDVKGTPEIIDDSPTCKTCVVDSIIPMFHEALKFEAKYPPTWGGGVELKPEHFEKYFTDYDTFKYEWMAKEYEYQTPAKRRLYCTQCGDFLSGLVTGSGKDTDQEAYCYKCDIPVCGKCGGKDHKAPDCPSTSKKEDDPFKEFRDTKHCPSCDTAHFLYEGCNAIRCTTCKASFCWVCLALRPKHDHWYVGQPCPKWNKPGDRNAQGLEPHPDDESDDDEEFPEVEIPDRIFEFQPPEAPEEILSHVSALAWLSVDPTEQLSAQADLAMSRLREKYPCPPDFSEVPEDVEAEVQLRTRRCREIFETDNTVLETMSESIFHKIWEPVSDGEEDEFRDVAGVTGIDRFVFDIVGAIRDVFGILYNRDEAEPRLEFLLESHGVILDLYQRRWQHEEVAREYPAMLLILTKYLIVAPERFAVAASGRHSIRVRIGLEQP
jgi:hypothetical protein